MKVLSFLLWYLRNQKMKNENSPPFFLEKSKMTNENTFVIRVLIVMIQYKQRTPDNVTTYIIVIVKLK